MTPSMKSTARLILILAGLMILVAGCSDNEVTAPDAPQAIIAEDPLDDVLKSTDGLTPEDPQERCTRLAEVLGLDEEQLAALSATYSEFREGMAELRDQVHSGELTMDEARDAAAVLRDAFEAELQIILTEEQWDILQDMRHEGRHGEDGDQQHDRDRDRDPQSPGDLWGEWMEELGLDETQITAVLEAFETFTSGMQDLRAQVQDGIITKEEAFEAAGVLRDDFDAALQSILTEEQYQALLDLRPDCGGRRGR